MKSSATKKSCFWFCCLLLLLTASALYFMAFHPGTFLLSHKSYYPLNQTTTRNHNDFEEGESTVDMIDMAFKYWMNRTQAFWNGELTQQAIEKARQAPVGYHENANGLSFYPSTTDAKIPLGYNAPLDFWFQRVYFSSKDRHFSYNFSENPYITFPSFKHRVSNVVDVFQSFVDKFPDIVDSITDFDFYVDVTDATRTHPLLFRSLARPILVQCNSPQDYHTIPIPDAHQLMGMNILANWSPPNREYAAFSKSMSERYDKDRYSVPWRNKADGLVYRGNYFPTFNTKNGVLFPRAETCSNISKSKNSDFLQKIDIGFQDAPKDICSCCGNNSNISYLKMANGWRYQLNIDGFSASFDGSFWKLGSNSTVFYVIADPDQQRLSRDYFNKYGSFAPIRVMWTSWYSPLLIPNEHYISVAPDQIEVALKWCEMHETVCEKIANNARNAITTLVSPSGIEKYLKAVITYLQQWQKRTHALYIHS